MLFAKRVPSSGVLTSSDLLGGGVPREACPQARGGGGGKTGIPPGEAGLAPWQPQDNTGPCQAVVTPEPHGLRCLALVAPPDHVARGARRMAEASEGLRRRSRGAFGALSGVGVAPAPLPPFGQAPPTRRRIHDNAPAGGGGGGSRGHCGGCRPVPRRGQRPHLRSTRWCCRHVSHGGVWRCVSRLVLPCAVCGLMPGL